jgi:hypothetical protein
MGLQFNPFTGKLDFTGSQATGATGPRGATGATGATGAQGATGANIPTIMNQLRVIPVTAQTFTAAVTGSANVGGDPGIMIYGGRANTTANSTLRFYPNNASNSLQGSLPANTNGQLNFSVAWSFSFQFSCAGQHSTATTYCLLGIPAATAYGDPTTRCVGLQVINGSVRACWHDGTTLQFSSAIGTADGFTIRRMLIENVGNGTVNWYWENSATPTFTTNLGPSGLSATNGETILCAFTNGANGQNNRAYLHDAKAFRTT